MVRRVAVNGTGRGTVACPRCDSDMAVEVPAELLRHSTPVRVRARCACGWGGWVEVERRVALRKRVRVEVEVVPEEGECLETIATDMSRTGLRLEPAPEGVAEGEELQVRFELCPERPQRFEKRVTVRWVENGAAGCSFVDETYDPAYDLALAQHPTAG